MVTIGDQLLQPEAGWKRIDDTNDRIIYHGFNKFIYPHHYNGACMQSINDNSAYITFYIKSKKLRIISSTYTGDNWNRRNETINIDINGIKSRCSQYSDNGFQTEKFMCVIFQEFNLDTISKVTIDTNGYSSTHGSGNIDTMFDAIDIDEDGQIITEEDYLNSIKPTYLIYDDNKYKTINNNLLSEIVDYKEHFQKPYDENVCINDISAIIPFIPQLNNNFKIIKNKKGV